MTASRTAATCTSLVRRHPIVLLLLIAHAALLFRYYKSLWSMPQYQYFPLAIGLWGWLFVTRDGGLLPLRSVRKTLLGCLLFADLALLIIAWGYPGTSPLAAATGTVVLMLIVGLQHRDVDCSRSLWYLTCLPAITLRLPLNYDNDLIVWLQHVTTVLASGALNQLGILHSRAGVLIELPGKTLQIAEACSGVQSLFTVLFLATVLVAHQRRTFLHGCLLVATGFVLAGVMNTLRIVSIALAWEWWQFDLAAGLRHEVLGYLVLVIAALLLYSADALLEFLFDAVPDVDRPGPTSHLRNPCISIWNRCLTIRSILPGSDSAAVVLNTAAESSRDGGVLGSRVRATVREAIQPGNAFQFVMGFLENWTFSRRPLRLLVAAPFLLAMMCGAVGMWLIRGDVDKAIVDRLEQQYDAATQAADVVRQELSLKALTNLRSQDAAYGFRLARFQVQQGRVLEGLDRMQALAEQPGQSSAEARKWLATQALSDKPLRRLSDSDLERHLTWLVANVPKDADGHEMLARFYLRQKDWRLAEQELIEAATIRPELNLFLAQLKQQLQREPTDVIERAQLAATALSAKLAADSSDNRVRISLADALLLAGRNSEARETLVSGLQKHDSQDLRRRLCEIDLLTADQVLSRSVLNRDAAGAAVVAALNIDPGNVAGLQFLARLKELGGTFESTRLDASLAYWTDQTRQHPDEDQAQAMLGQLKFITGDVDAATTLLRPLAERRPQLRMTLARLLIKENPNSEEGLSLLAALITESQARLVEKFDDEAAAATLADSLLLKNDPAGAREALRSFLPQDDTQKVPRSPELSSIFGRACLAQYDQLTGLARMWNEVNVPVPAPVDTGAETAELLELLGLAMQCPASSGPAIDRLAQLSLSEHSAAEPAQRAVRSLRLEGPHGAQALNLIGMHALLKKQYAFARENLERARVASPSDNPMILNNLATAIVRDGSGDFGQALEFANRAVELLDNHPDTLSTRGEVYLALNRWSEAISDLTKAVNNRRDTAENHRLLEQACLGNNDPDMAAAHRARAEELEAAAKVP